MVVCKKIGVFTSIQLNLEFVIQEMTGWGKPQPLWLGHVQARAYKANAAKNACIFYG